MSKFGAAKAGWGKATKLYQAWKKKKAQAKIESGKSTREERIMYGGRSPDIKTVPVSKDVKKGDVKESIRKGKQHFYLKNIDEAEKHKKAIAEGEKAKKKLKDMTKTKRAYYIGKSIHPSDPAKGNK
jgi:hypothetical protein